MRSLPFSVTEICSLRVIDLILYNQDFGVEIQQSAKHVLATVPLADLNALALKVDSSQSRHSVLHALGNPSAPVTCWELCVQARWVPFIPWREILKHRNGSFWISVSIYYPRRQTSCFQPINFGPTQSTNYCKLQKKSVRLAFHSGLGYMRFTKVETNPLYTFQINHAVVHFSSNPKYVIVKEAKCVLMCTLYKALQDVTESHWKLWEACYSSHKVLTEGKLSKVHIINVKA